MDKGSFSVAVSADSYNAMLFLGKVSRVSDTRGLVGNLRIEHGDSVKIKLDIDTNETIKRAKEIIQKQKKVRLLVDIDVHYVKRLLDAIIDYIKRRQQRIRERKLKGYVEIIGTSEG